MLDLIDHPLTGTPFGTALTVCVLIAAAAWLLSVVTREVSWVDRLWPICPPISCLIVAAEADFASARINLMTVLWGARPHRFGCLKASRPYGGCWYSTRPPAWHRRLGSEIGAVGPCEIGMVGPEADAA